MSVTFPTVTGYQGFWVGNGDFVTYSPIARAAQGWRSKLEWQIAQLMLKQQYREQRALFTALIGAVAGGTATSTFSRVQAPAGPSGTPPAVTGTGDLGGLVPIETVTVINRATTAADVSYLKDIMSGSMVPAGKSPSITFPADLGGNGGGGRLGF